jgi:glycosyltransferase involved in cell wall biosynthesis
MNVLTISSQPPLNTSGIAAWDFHKNLLKHGDSSKFLTLYSPSSGDDSIVSYFNRSLDKFLFLVKRKLLRGRAKEVNPDYYYNGETLIPPFVNTKKIMDKLRGFTPDVIVIFFEKRFITARTLYELSRITGAPIYWYLMDMQPMTGGCSYTKTCTGYQNTCGNCPAIQSSNPFDITAQNLINAHNYYDKINLTVIAASEQLRSQAASSTLFKNKRIAKIPLGIDGQLFKPLTDSQKEAIRAKYGLPIHKRIIFFGAVSTLEKRKGASYLLEAFELLAKSYQNIDFENIAIVIAGSSSKELKVQLEKLTSFAFSIYSLGFLETHDALAEILGAADIFISASIEDSGPMMVNQAIMCGTPVVAFNIGVAQDLVINGISGQNVGTINSRQLAEGIFHLATMDTEHFIELREKTSAFGRDTCSLENNYKSFKKLLTTSLSLHNEAST